MTTAFVLGGGGLLGAHQVGMLQALIESAITPDLIVGTSIGAVNGAMIAADPSLATIQRMADLWTLMGQKGVLDSSIFEQIKTFSQSGTHLQSNASLRQLFTDAFKVERFEDLMVPFQCVAASIEAASIHYFANGSLVDAVLASSAMPGLLPSDRTWGNDNLRATSRLDRSAAGSTDEPLGCGNGCLRNRAQAPFRRGDGLCTRCS